MKACTSHTIEWDHTRESKIDLPKNCLSYTIVNNGSTQVMVDDSITLDPNEVFPVAYHSGFFHVGRIEFKVSDNQAPYSEPTKVLIRLTLAI